MSLKPRHLVWTAGLFAFSLFGGCTPDLGTPDYSDPVLPNPEPSSRFSPLNPPPVPPDPYEPGEDRLSVGYFYESGRSETIPINTVTTNYFVFDTDQNEPPGTTRSFVEGTSNDRLEGLESYQITLIDCLPPPAFCFWGSGILWDEPIDLSDWTTMFVSFKSSDPSFATFELALASGEGEDPPGVTLDPTDYGYTNDGQWYSLEIRLQDLSPRFNSKLTRSPFTIAGPRPQRGDVLLVDNLYFTKDVTGGTGGTGGMGGQAGTGGTAGAGGSGGGTGGSGGSVEDVVYEQDFNGLDINAADALSANGWLFFASVFDASGDPPPKFTYGANPAPNASASPSDTFISAVVSGEGGLAQEPQQLSVFNDYDCCQQTGEGHFNGTDRVEINVFQEPYPNVSGERIPLEDIGKTITFSFDAKRGNIEGATTALAYIQTLDPNAGFSRTNFVTIDMTNLAADSWNRYTISLDLTDPLLVGQTLQFGFQNTASDFEGSGNFYDNVLATLSTDSGGGGGTGGGGMGGN